MMLTQGRFTKKDISWRHSEGPYIRSDMPFKPSYGNPMEILHFEQAKNTWGSNAARCLIHSVPWYDLSPPLLPMCVRMQMCEASEAKAKKKKRQNAQAGRSMQHDAAYAETIGTPPSSKRKLRHLRPAQVFSQEKCPCHICLTCHVTVRCANLFRWLKRMDKFSSKSGQAAWGPLAYHCVCRLFIYSV